MLSAIPDLSAQEKTNSGALCKRDRNNNKTTVVVVVAISHYSIYIPLLRRFLFLFTLRAVQGEVRVQHGDIFQRSCKIALFTFDYANSVTRIMTSKVI